MKIWEKDLFGQVMNHITEFCEKMGLEVEGKETEVFDFLATLGAARKKAALRIDEEEMGEGGERTVLHGREVREH